MQRHHGTTPAVTVKSGTSLTDVRTIGDAAQLAELMIRSGLFKSMGGPAEAVIRMMYGRELGLPPITAMTSIDVVEGKPAPSAGLILSLIEQHPDYDYQVGVCTDESAEVTFLRRRQDGEWVTRGTATFTIKEAARAGMTGRKSWQRYPGDMLFARAVTRGARRYCPDLFRGISPYTAEELGGDTSMEQEPVAASHGGPEVVEGVVSPVDDTEVDDTEPTDGGTEDQDAVSDEQLAEAMQVVIAEHGRDAAVTAWVAAGRPRFTVDDTGMIATLQAIIASTPTGDEAASADDAEAEDVDSDDVSAIVAARVDELLEIAGGDHQWLTSVLDTQAGIQDMTDLSADLKWHQARGCVTAAARERDQEAGAGDE